MPLQSVPKRNWAGGIDAFSSKSNIPEGFVENLNNVDANADGSLETRKGYQGYYGGVPLRASQVQHSGTYIRIQFDTSQAIDLSAIGKGPLLVSGKLNTASAPGGGYAGDFGLTTQTHWYDSFTVENRETLSAPSGTITKTALQHGLSTPYQFVGIAEASSLITHDNIIAMPDQIKINSSTYQMELDYTISASSDAFMWIADKSAVAGTTYITSVAGVTTKTITAGTHALSNFNIGVKCFDTATSAGYHLETMPDSITIDGAGEVVVTFATAFTGDIVLTACPTTNIYTQVASVGTNTLTISNCDTAFPFLYVYAWNSSTLKYESVIIDNAAYDESTNEITITYEMIVGSESVEVYYEFGQPISNIIQIVDTGAVSESYTCATPSIVVWGIGHEGIYRDETLPGGHVTHIDSFRRSGEARFICGLGGSFYSARTRAESGTSYLMPSYSLNARARIEGDTYLSPLFHTNASIATRTRGLVKDASIADNKATVIAATYFSSGIIDYTLAFTNKTGTIAIGGVVSTSDYLTITGMPFDELNGTFAISSITSDSVTATIIRVTNSSVTNSTKDCTGCSGRAGIFTDTFACESAPLFFPSDIFSYGGMSSSLSLTVKSVSSVNVYISGVTSSFALPDGVRVFAGRTASVIPIRDDTDATTVEDLVRGDMLTISSFNHQPRIKFINTASNIASTIVGDGTTATVTTGSTHRVNEGSKILISGCSVLGFNGGKTVLSVTSTTTFTFTSTTTSASVGATLVGKTIELDESIYLSDALLATTLSVTGRWIPIEAPTSVYNQPVETYVKYLDANEYANQPVVRSTMMNDTMLFTNGDDEVMKFDGTNIYRAGLPKWPLQAFVNVDTTTGSIVPDITQTTYSASSGNKFTAPLGTESVLQVGQRIVDSIDNAIYTITDIGTNGNAYIYVDRDISSSHTGTPTLTRTTMLSYYCRLNLIDANNNIIASATTGYKDVIVEITSACQIKLRFIGMPVLDNFNFDRIDFELYRTKRNTLAPFYKVRKSLISFNKYEGYIDVIDAIPDELLSDLDNTSVSLLGSELGLSWEAPPRAKYISSANNRLLLANLTAFPKLDINLRLKASSVAGAASDIAGLIWLLRRDSIDTGTTTDMTNRARYEFVNSGSATISPFSLTCNSTSFTIATGSPPAVGSWVYLFHNTVRQRADLSFAGWWQVSSIVAATSFTCKFNNSVTITAAKTFVDADVNTGTDTITISSHGFNNGDRVMLQNSGGALPGGLAAATSYFVVGATGSTLQLALTSGGSAIDITSAAGGGTHSIILDVYINKMITATTASDVPVWIGTDGNYNTLYGNLATSESIERIGATRLAYAINASMRMTDVEISGQTSFVPWMLANSGNIYKTGQLIIEAPKATAESIELVLPAIGGSNPFEIYVHGIKRAASATVGVQEVTLPSRVAISYPNFAEIFDDVSAEIASLSDSCIDINSADGQEITGIIPFFGESAFGASPLSSSIVVFKTASIYLLDLSNRSVQKIDSRGLGCTAPFSIAPSKNGVVFANASGIYLLARDLSVKPVYKRIKRLWDGDVNKDALSEATGHQYAYGRKYKLSFPVTDELFNSKTFVYDYEKEGQDMEYGSWTVYDNHPVKGWANLEDESVFGSTSGRVFSIRHLNEANDYRDDASAISTEIILKADDFGLPGLRKYVANIVATIESEITDISGLQFSSASSMSNTFYAAGTATIEFGDNKSNTFVVSVTTKKGTHFQLKLVHNTIDQVIKLSQISWYTKALTTDSVKDRIEL